jgi:hypothetical protein
MLKTAMLTLTIALWVTTGLAGGCGAEVCAAGAAGQGGVASDGKAQGFNDTGPAATSPDIHVTNVGNYDAGHIVLSGDRVGTLSGTYRSDIGRGHATGYFGDDSGLL